MKPPEGKKPKKRSTRKRNVNAAFRRRKALEMRRDGFGLQAIATALGMAISSVHETITVGLAETVQPVSDEMRELELQRLDRLQQRNNKAVLAGNVDAIRVAVKIIEARAKLLGMNAPEKVEMSGPGGRPLSLVVDTGLVAEPVKKKEPS